MLKKIIIFKQYKNNEEEEKITNLSIGWTRPHVFVVNCYERVHEFGVKLENAQALASFDVPQHNGGFGAHPHHVLV